MKIQQYQQSATSFFMCIRTTLLFSLTLSECFKFELRNKMYNNKSFQNLFYTYTRVPKYGGRYSVCPPSPGSSI